MKVTFVVMDCYDESTFERCMQSIALQSMQDYEVLAVGMRDAQQITAHGITARYLPCLDNVQDMLETALDAAQGEHVCFIDSVHCFSPFFAEKMTEMCADGADMAGCGWTGVQWDTPLEQVGVPLMLYRPQTVTAEEFMQMLTAADTDSMEKHNFFENKLYRRSLLEKCRALATDDTVETGIVQKLAQNCEKVAVTDEPLLFVCIE